MSTLAIAAPFEPWCVDYHKTMAAAFTVGNAIRKSASIFELTRDFWSCTRNFRSLMNDLEVLTEIPADLIAPLNGRLLELYRAVNRVLDVSHKKGLTNRTFINGSIQSLYACNARLQDYLERLDLSLNINLGRETEEALAEYERGETVSLDSLL